MSTRWQITARLSDGQYGTIYVHHDGYPSYALTTLNRSYTDQSKIEALIAQGDLSSIDDNLEDNDRYADREYEDWDDIKPTIASSAVASASQHRHGDEEYGYLWDGKVWSKTFGRDKSNESDD